MGLGQAFRPPEGAGLGRLFAHTGKDGLLVSIRSIPTNLKEGAIDLNQLPELYQIDVVKRYPSGYELEPGVEYDEIVAWIVPKAGMYAVGAVMDLGDNEEIDHTTIIRIE